MLPVAEVYLWLDLSSIQVINIISNPFLLSKPPQILIYITPTCLQFATITKPPLSGTSLPTSSPTALNIPSSLPTTVKLVKVITEISLTARTTRDLKRENHLRLKGPRLTTIKAPRALLTLKCLSHPSLLKILLGEPSPSALVDTLDLTEVAGVAVADVDPADAAVAGRIHPSAIST